MFLPNCVDKKKLQELIELTSYGLIEYKPLNFRVGRNFLEYFLDFSIYVHTKSWYSLIEFLFFLNYLTLFYLNLGSIDLSLFILIVYLKFLNLSLDFFN